MHCNSGSSFGEGWIINTPISLFKGINFKKAPGPGTEPSVCPVRPQLPFPSVPWGSYCCCPCLLLLQRWLMRSRVWTCTQLFRLQSVILCQTQAKHHAECLGHWVLYLFILASFVSAYVLSLTEALKKNGKVRPCPFFCSSSDSEQLCFIVMQCKCVLHLWWCRPGRKTTIFEAIGNNSLNWMLFLDTGRVFFPLHKQVCGFEGSCSSLCGKCLKTNHKKLEQNQLLPPL